MNRFPPRRVSEINLCLMSAALLLGAPALAGGTGDPAMTPAAVTDIDPKLAGARYGQAAGVALVCFSMKTLPATADLKARYSGANLDVFNTEAETVLSAWRDLQSCRHAGGPNECRLTILWSCRDAMREIGPNGSALAGLVDVK